MGIGYSNPYIHSTTILCDDKDMGVIEEPPPDNEAHPGTIERSQSMPPYAYNAQQSYGPFSQQNAF